MAAHRYMDVPADLCPTDGSIAELAAQGAAEARPCAECGEPVTAGARVARLTADGEEWRHPEHAEHRLERAGAGRPELAARIRLELARRRRRRHPRARRPARARAARRPRRSARRPPGARRRRPPYPYLPRPRRPAGPLTMPAYATVADFEAYVEGWTTTNADVLTRLLERASRDIDAILGPRAILTTGAFAGQKLNPNDLHEWEAAALARATCAQAEYRNSIGEEGFAEHAAGGRVKGPDFEAELPTSPAGTRPRIGPKVTVELEPIRHLRMLHARARLR